MTGKIKTIFASLIMISGCMLIPLNAYAIVDPGGTDTGQCPSGQEGWTVCPGDSSSVCCAPTASECDSRCGDPTPDPDPGGEPGGGPSGNINCTTPQACPEGASDVNSSDIAGCSAVGSSCYGAGTNANKVYYCNTCKSNYRRISINVRLVYGECSGTSISVNTCQSCAAEQAQCKDDTNWSPVPGTGYARRAKRTWNANTCKCSVSSYEYICRPNYYGSEQNCTQCPEGYGTDGYSNSNSEGDCYRSCSVDCTPQSCPDHATCTHYPSSTSGTEYYGSECNAASSTCRMDYTCDDGYKSTPASSSIKACIMCDNGTVTNNATCSCNRGYYMSSNVCTQCPNGGQTDGGATSLTQCYVPVGAKGTDISGTFTYRQICYHE